jgi:hypothetical protein
MDTEMEALLCMAKTAPHLLTRREIGLMVAYYEATIERIRAVQLQMALADGVKE